jgi:hypothetical protein
MDGIFISATHTLARMMARAKLCQAGNGLKSLGAAPGAPSSGRIVPNGRVEAGCVRCERACPAGLTAGRVSGPPPKTDVHPLHGLTASVLMLRPDRDR